MSVYNAPGYSYGFIDLPGVVASNNFLSIFNPATSTAKHRPLEVGFTCYTASNVSTIGSLAAYVITAASSGTLVNSATDVNRFSAAAPAPQVEIRVSNPTVTRLNNTPLLFKAPVVSTGGGNSGTVTIAAPTSSPFTLPPGTGLVFNTAAGDILQRWCLVYAWEERSLTGIL